MTKTQFFVLISIFSAFAACICGISAGSIGFAWMIASRPELAFGSETRNEPTQIAVVEIPATLPPTAIVAPPTATIARTTDTQLSPVVTETPAQYPVSSITPSDPHQALEVEIRKILGPSNRKVEPLLKLAFDDPEPGAIFINWSINDNLTEGLIKFGAKKDATEILKAISNSGIDFTYVILSGSFPLADAFGKSEEKNVVNLTFNKETVDRIQWETFLSDNIYKIADEAHIWTVFQDE